MFNTPPITKNLLIINLLAFVATLVYPQLADIGGLHFFMASDFSVLQLLTYMFLHGGWAHLLFNMLALWMFGRVMESVWGGNSDAPMLVVNGMPFPHGQLPEYLNLFTTVGASGAIYAILLAFGMTFPNERIFIFPIPIPIKAKWFVIFYAALELFSAIGSSGDGVAHMAHLGGMLFGFFMIRYWNRHPGVGYGPSNGRQFFDSLKDTFDNYRRRHAGGKAPRDGSRDETARTRSESDWEYNARKKAEQDEIDRILDKIRKSGYDSLTKEEKRKLFDSSDN